MDYENCTFEEMLLHMQSISRQRINQKLSVARKQGKDILVQKILRGRKELSKIKRASKGATVFGVGRYVTEDKLKNPHVFSVWTGMLRRCYGASSKKCYPSYVGVTISTEFLDFSIFASWYTSQKGYGIVDFELDKDLLSESEKTYSMGTCSLIPGEINRALAELGQENGLPTGVVENTKGSYYAKYRNKHLGAFSTAEEAKREHDMAKYSHLSDLFEKWRSSIEERAWGGLVRYLDKLKEDYNS